MSELLHGRTTDLILKAFYQVHNILGYGFLERVYSKSLLIAGTDLGLSIQYEFPIQIYFKGIRVAKYKVDLVADRVVLIELKAARAIAEEHEAQLLNYLKATTFEVGLLLNFGPKPEFRRRVFENSRKGGLQWIKDADLR